MTGFEPPAPPPEPNNGPPPSWGPPAGGGYGPPPGGSGYGGPGGYLPPGRGPAGPQPPSYLVGAILTTLFCCLPFGVVSIVYAAQVSSKYNAGDFFGAMESSKKAKTWMIASLAVGLVVSVLWIAAIAATSSSSTGTDVNYNYP